MWQRTLRTHRPARLFSCCTRQLQAESKPIISINNGTFYKNYPSTADTPGSNPSIFPGLSFVLPSGTKHDEKAQYWSVVSPSSLARTTFLKVLAGQLICTPPNARSYPYLSDISKSPQHVIKYVGFDAERGSSVGGTNVRGAYLSARYESRREETDFSLHDYLIGHTELNALERNVNPEEMKTMEEVSAQLNLNQLISMPVANLSNEQTRRARIAKALMARPEVLLLDGPFMGLDPRTLATMSEVLKQLAATQQPRLIMSLRPEDGVPDWVTHLVVIGNDLKILVQGSKDEVFPGSKAQACSVLTHVLATSQRSAHTTNAVPLSRDGYVKTSPPHQPGEALVEMSGVKVAYGDKVVLGDWSHKDTSGLHWSLHRGQRCGIFGPNGSGKTTMLSLITSDHPQTYSLPIKLFGRSRLPSPGQPGISVFDLQQRMGHSSPEVHAFFPRNLTVRRAVSSAWADAPMAKPKLTQGAKSRVDACLRWFASELDSSPGQDLDSSDTTRFAELSFSNQRLVLFIRAIVASPDLVILDEALSGIDEATRDKALLFLSHGEKISAVIDGQAQRSQVDMAGNVVFPGLSPDQALLVISHSKEDVPGCLREWICLPEPGEGKRPRTGSLPGPLELNPRSWDDIWGR